MLHKGSCHCKAIEFEIESDLDKIMQCNCSICIRKNAKMIMVPKNNFKLTKGDADISTYQFNLNLAEHFFCKHCGIYTHHNRRTDLFVCYDVCKYHNVYKRNVQLNLN